MSRRDDEELMAYVDGELSPAEARVVEARLASDAEARAKVEALGDLSTLVRAHYEDATAKVLPDMAGAWARLEAQLGTPLAARDSASPAVEAPRTKGFWQALVDAFSPRWSHLATGLVGAAAGALLVTQLSRPSAPPSAEKIDSREASPRPLVVPAVAEETQVNELEVQNGAGMVFQVPGQSADKAPTTVIWVNDDSSAEGPI